MLRIPQRWFLEPKKLIRQKSTGRLPTIYALSTHLSRAAIGVIRVSGPNSTKVLAELTNKKLPKPRMAQVRKLYDPTTRKLLDEALSIYFSEPKTYTGEDLVEFHVHGGTAVIQSVLKAIESLHTPEAPIRYAEAGEFSRRAFSNGRFDLSEIEGIRELINAETEQARIAAINSATGWNKQLFEKWREKMVHNLGLLTAIIDFAEDTEIEGIERIYSKVSTNLEALKSEVEYFLEKGTRSELLLKGIKVTLLGPPNAGKSSILNKLSSSEAAIVSEIAGTTRDVINVPMDIQGYKVVIGDTAGIRDLTLVDKIEAEGIERAKKFAQASELVLVVLGCDNLTIDEELKSNIKVLSKQKKILIVLNKSDLVNENVNSAIDNLSKELEVNKESFLAVSCLNETGLSQLTLSLIEEFKIISLTQDTDPLILTTRVKDILLNDVLYGFEEFKAFKELDDIVLATQGLQHSIEGIGKITGETVGIEEVLGVVFSSFCVGK